MESGEKPPVADFSADTLISHACASSPDSALLSTIEAWVNNGLPLFEDLLGALYAHEIIQDATTHTLLFNVCGGYMHHFGNAFRDTADLEQSHHHAFTALTKDERIAQIAQGLMQNAVLSGVEKVVD